jgi:hypothetical protein
MELFTQLFGDLLAFVYHCFDRIVILRLPQRAVAARAGGALASGPRPNSRVTSRHFGKHPQA